MLTNDIAIVGIDSQFGGYTNIDRVARALYLGNSLSSNSPQLDDENLSWHSTEVIGTSIYNLVKQIVSKAPLINAMFETEQVYQLHVIVVSEQAVDIQDEQVDDSLKACFFNEAYETAQISNVQVVSQLSEALLLTSAYIEQDKLVALVGVHQVIERWTSNNANTISFDEKFSHYQSTSGIASLLLISAQLAKQNNLSVYGEINAVQVSDLDIDAMSEAITASLGTVKKEQVEQINLVEVSAHKDDQLSDLESSALLQAYKGEQLTRAITCSRNIAGDSGGFSQVLGLLRTVIALYQRYVPGISHWQEPKTHLVDKWQSSSFYFPTESRPLFPKPKANQSFYQQSAAYSCVTAESYCHIVLTEPNNTLNTQLNVRGNGHLANSELKLILINGEDEQAIQQKLNKLAIRLSETAVVNDDLKLIADHHYQDFCQSGENQYCLALLSDSISTLRTEISIAQQGISEAFQKQLDWKTPKGSFFSPRPASQHFSLQKLQNKANNVCFMYPGIGATYVGLGRDLFQLFPEIYPDVVALADDIASSLKDPILNPRSITRLDFKVLKQKDLALREKLADIAEAGVAFSCVFSKIFSHVFKLTPEYATGYSMGEVSMYAALGCWQQPSLMSDRLAKSATFNERISGDLLNLRETWSLPLNPNKSHENQAPIWETYAVKATLAAVEQACMGEARVFCTIINTPDNLLLAGFPEDCLRVISKLGVRAIPMNMANAIHSPPAKAEYKAMVSLYSMAVNDRINTKLYSSSCYLPVPQLSKAIANSIAKCLCERVDFPRLVQALYNNGARVFIEMGPGRSLSTWVDKILIHKEVSKQEANQTKRDFVDQEGNTLSVAINTKGVSDELSFIRAIAQLVSHGVKIDLSCLFTGSILITNSD